MFSIPGRPVHTVHGWSRREWLRFGSLAGMGLAWPDLWRQQALAQTRPEARPSFGRAKSCIVLFLFGGPPHQDIWDLKPNAPQAIRGEFSPIATCVPGIHVGEVIPLLAQQMDQMAIVRSVTHPDNTHTVAMHSMLTGVRHLRPESNPQNAPDDFPCFGAVAQHLFRHRKSLPGAVSLNAPANQVSANNHIFPGFFAGWLGSGNDPMFVPRNANSIPLNAMPEVEDLSRLRKRHELLSQMELSDGIVPASPQVRQWSGEYAKALDLLSSAATRQAFDIEQERPEVRERFGQTPFGQGCLLARRLVERGVSLVTVNWERDDAFWDTHRANFKDCREKLCPNLDQGASALLADLRERGLLDETLVVCFGEFGRTPQINADAGRDHWAPCNSVWLAGAGIQGGTVHGSSDKHAAYPASDPVTPGDLAATIYHLMGVPSETLLADAQGRPYQISRGEPLWPLV